MAAVCYPDKQYCVYFNEVQYIKESFDQDDNIDENSIPASVPDGEFTEQNT
jgi:hypothetical protein